MNDARLPVGDDVRFEALLEDALGGARRPIPFEVDVADAVMERVAELGPAPTGELGPAQLRWWSAAAASIGVVVLTGAAGSAPSLHEIVAGAGRLTGPAVGAVAKTGVSLGSALHALGVAALALIDAAGAAASPLAQLQPVAAVLLTGVAAGMAGTTIFLVGRDLRAGALPKEQA